MKSLIENLSNANFHRKGRQGRQGKSGRIELWLGTPKAIAPGRQNGVYLHGVEPGDRY
jgi:hypothetical protein